MISLATYDYSRGPRGLACMNKQPGLLRLSLQGRGIASKRISQSGSLKDNRLRLKSPRIRSHRGFPASRSHTSRCRTRMKLQSRPSSQPKHDSSREIRIPRAFTTRPLIICQEETHELLSGHGRFLCAWNVELSLLFGMSIATSNLN